MQWILVCILIFKRRRLFEWFLLTLCLSLVHGGFTVALSAILPPHHHSSPFQSVSIHRTGILQIPFLSMFWPWFHLQGNLASCHTRVMPTAALTGKWKLSLFFFLWVWYSFTVPCICCLCVSGKRVLWVNHSLTWLNADNFLSQKHSQTCSIIGKDNQGIKSYSYSLEQG